MHPENNKGGTPMKKLLAVLLTVALMASLLSFAGAEDYTIRIYSNSNSPERTTWLIEKAKEAGFTISIDDNTVISGDTAAVQAANEKKDGDLIFGLNETRWSQLINGTYENLKIADWTPTWADQTGEFKYDGKAYGIVIQNVLMLYPFVDPESPAGGISVEGWKTLWKYCANGNFTGDKYGLDPLIRGDVQVSTERHEWISRRLTNQNWKSMPAGPKPNGAPPRNTGNMNRKRKAGPTSRPKSSKPLPNGSVPPRPRLPGLKNSTAIPATVKR